MTTEVKEQKEEIQGLALARLKEFFSLTLQNYDKITSELAKYKYNQARLGLQFDKEMGIQQRAVERTIISISKLVSDSKETIKEYLDKKLPQYI